jgi:predicted phosphodiesterase
MTNKTPESVLAAKLCRQFPKTPSRTLAKRLATEMKITVEQARSRIRYARGTRGKQKLKYAVAKTEKGHAGWVAQCPPSLAKAWEPFTLEGGRVGVLSDIHLPYHDQPALLAAVGNLRKWKPDCILLNGDTIDFYAISRWQKDPRERDFKAEVKTTIEFLKWLRSLFPKSPIVFKKGNHEDRWDHYLWNHAPEICDMEFAMLEHVLKFEEIGGIEMVEDERPIMAGKLPIFHGHELPKGLTNPVNMARGAFLRTSHTILVGHGHRTSGHAESDLWHDEVFCWSTGCLCNMRPKFARINKWNHGFAQIEIENDKSFNVENLRISKDGKVRSS